MQLFRCFSPSGVDMGGEPEALVDGTGWTFLDLHSFQAISIKAASSKCRRVYQAYGERRSQVLSLFYSLHILPRFRRFSSKLALI